MKKRKKIYSVFEVASSLFMMLVLFWLTISFSLTYEVSQQLSRADSKGKISIFCTDNGGVASSECSSPLNIPIEEKTPGGLNQVVEEYLHDHNQANLILLSGSRYFKYESVSQYVGFHGELLVPPPNIA